MTKGQKKIKGKEKNLITSVHYNTNFKCKILIKNTPSLKIAGMALKGQYNLVSIMVPREVFLCPIYRQALYSISQVIHFKNIHKSSLKAKELLYCAPAFGLSFFDLTELDSSVHHKKRFVYAWSGKMKLMTIICCIKLFKSKQEQIKDAM